MRDINIIIGSKVFDFFIYLLAFVWVHEIFLSLFKSIFYFNIFDLKYYYFMCPTIEHCYPFLGMFSLAFSDDAKKMKL